MKKTFLLLLAMLSLLACKRDEGNQKPKPNPTPQQELSLVGKWQLEKIIIYSGKDNSILEEIQTDECTKKTTYEFTQEGDFIFIMYRNNDNKCVKEELNHKYFYNASEKKIAHTPPHLNPKDNADASIINVVALSKNELSLTFHIRDYNNDGVNDKLVETYKRIK
ncbi:MAG: lipocalin family protein [Flavobacteriaceae bacterium]|nr:lipocalin family protein [Flavobacteriaceae bacterium]